MGEKIHGRTTAKHLAGVSSYHLTAATADLIFKDLLTPSSFPPSFTTTTLMEPFLKKRSPEGSGAGGISGNLRYERMMRNRLSAARSRARRTAYTFQLENEKTFLKEENARLRKALQEPEQFSGVAVAAAAAMSLAYEETVEPKKGNLCMSRSSSALF